MELADKFLLILPIESRFIELMKREWMAMSISAKSYGFKNYSDFYLDPNIKKQSKADNSPGVKDSFKEVFEEGVLGKIDVTRSDTKPFSITYGMTAYQNKLIEFAYYPFDGGGIGVHIKKEGKDYFVLLDDMDDLKKFTPEKILENAKFRISDQPRYQKMLQRFNEDVAPLRKKYLKEIVNQIDRNQSEDQSKTKEPLENKEEEKVKKLLKDLSEEEKNRLNPQTQEKKDKSVQKEESEVEKLLRENSTPENTNEDEPLDKIVDQGEELPSPPRTEDLYPTKEIYLGERWGAFNPRSVYPAGGIANLRVTNNRKQYSDLEFGKIVPVNMPMPNFLIIDSFKIENGAFVTPVDLNEELGSVSIDQKKWLDVTVNIALQWNTEVLLPVTTNTMLKKGDQIKIVLKDSSHGELKLGVDYVLNHYPNGRTGITLIRKRLRLAAISYRLYPYVQKTASTDQIKEIKNKYTIFKNTVSNSNIIIPEKMNIFLESLKNKTDENIVKETKNYVLTNFKYGLKDRKERIEEDKAVSKVDFTLAHEAGDCDVVNMAIGALLKEKFKIPTRMIAAYNVLSSGDITVVGHAYLEVFLNNRWRKVDFTPIKLNSLEELTDREISTKRAKADHIKILLKKETEIGGIRYKANTMLTLAYGMVKEGYLANDTLIKLTKPNRSMEQESSALTFKGGEKISFDYPGGVKSGVLASDTEIAGIMYKGNKKIDFYHGGHVKSGLLASDSEIIGIKMKGNSLIAIDERGELSQFTLAEDMVIDKVFLSAGTVVKYERGHLKEALLAKDTELKPGLIFKGFTSVNFSNPEDIGEIKSGIIAKDIKFEEIIFKKDTEINFSKGKVISGVLAHDQKINNIVISGNSLMRYGHKGYPAREFLLAKDTEIKKGLILKEGTTLIAYQSGYLVGILAENYKSGRGTYKSGTEIQINSNDIIELGTLAEDFEHSGELGQLTFKKDSEVIFDKKGDLYSGTLAKDTFIKVPGYSEQFISEGSFISRNKHGQLTIALNKDTEIEKGLVFRAAIAYKKLTSFKLNAIEAIKSNDGISYDENTKTLTISSKLKKEDLQVLLKKDALKPYLEIIKELFNEVQNRTLIFGYRDLGLNLREGAIFRYGMFTKDTIVDEIKFKADQIIIFGSLKNNRWQGVDGRLADDVMLENITFKANTYVRVLKSKEGVKKIWGVIVADKKIGGVQIPAGSSIILNVDESNKKSIEWIHYEKHSQHQGVDIFHGDDVVFNDGKITEIKNKDFSVRRIQGIMFGPYSDQTTEGNVLFHENGKVYSGNLAEPTKIEGKQFSKGNRVFLDENGKLQKN